MRNKLWEIFFILILIHFVAKYILTGPKYIYFYPKGKRSHGNACRIEIATKLEQIPFKG